MRLLALSAVAASVLVATPAAAQSMNAQAFYAMAQGLMGKGPFAFFSADYKKLKAEGTASGHAAHYQRMAALKAGQTPRYCPASEVNGMGQMDFLNRLGKIPQAERQRIDMVEATNRILASKYPCKG